MDQLKAALNFSTKKLFLVKLFTFCGLLFAASIANAALDIEISGGSAQQIPIAVVPFGGADTKENIGEIVAADLKRSGLFRVLETRGMANLPTTAAQIKYAEWVALQAQAVTVGNVEAAGNRLKVSFQLMDALKQSQLAGMDYQIAPSQARATAHKIADIIYQKLTGQPGAFASRIAYITKTGKRYALQVADADGFNPQTVVSSNEPIISPAWSPDGNKLAYVSFEKKKPIIFVQSLTSGNREVLANFKGNNSAPAWSPDGSKLAIVLTYAANSQIYTISSGGGDAKLITKSNAIDTSPTFSPDGSHIYFASDRGGRPQIYKVPVAGGSPSRVTFEGAYNDSPRFSPDGKSLAYIRNDGGKFRVAMQDLSSGQVQLLSEGSQDESPSFSPNGRTILYATKVRGRGQLAAVSTDGKVRQRLNDATGGDVREPAWSPIAN
jgi:TolB protein